MAERFFSLASTVVKGDGYIHPMTCRIQYIYETRSSHALWQRKAQMKDMKTFRKICVVEDVYDDCGNIRVIAGCVDSPRNSFFAPGDRIAILLLLKPSLCCYLVEEMCRFPQPFCLRDGFLVNK